MSDESEQTLLLMDVVDDAIRSGVNRLLQKLKGFRAEMVAKQETVAFEDSEVARLDEAELASFITEIDTAIQSVEYMMQLPLTAEITQDDFLASNKERLEKMKAVIEQNVEMVSKARDQL